jgi:8-oxo-dGTP pyrophosphatase MutT (NUDIX family)
LPAFPGWSASAWSTARWAICRGNASTRWPSRRGRPANDGKRHGAAHSQAARILLFDTDGRLLLFRFTPEGRSPFWATPGGECDPGEDWADAARRELLEETGIVADPGPVIAARGNDFVTFDGEPVTADERYFRIRVSAAAIDTSGHTELERRLMCEHRWFDRAELAAGPNGYSRPNCSICLTATAPARNHRPDKAAPCRIAGSDNERKRRG